MTRAFLLAGESSGDLQGSLLARELRARSPDLELWGVGGKRMAAEGVRLIRNSDSLSVVGFSEVVSMLPRLLQALREVRREIDRLQPDVFIPIDYPDFNFRLLRYVHKRNIPIVYYIGPQVWAWRPGRIETLKRYVDRVIVIFPFEESIYRERGVPVTWVGHPLVDRVPEDLKEWRARLRTDLGLGAGPTIALLPGSRRSEVRRIAPLLKTVRERIEGESREPIQWIIGKADAIDREILSAIAPGAAFAPGLEALAAADLAVIASGTATLEALLVGTPSIVVYRTSALTYEIARRLVRVPHIAMANLVAEERLLPEFVQSDADPAHVARIATEWIRDPTLRDGIRGRLLAARQRLGPRGAAGRAADAILEVARSRVRT